MAGLTHVSTAPLRSARAGLDTIDPDAVWVVVLSRGGFGTGPRALVPAQGITLGGWDNIVTPGGAASGSMRPFGARTAVVHQTDRFASEDFTTAANDPVEPNRWFDGRIENAGGLTRTVSLVPFEGAPLAITHGEVVLANADGALDHLPDIAQAQGITIRVGRGQRAAGLDTFQVLSTGIVRGIDVGPDSCTIDFAGTEVLFEHEFEGAAYQGTGDLEGPITLTDARKPLVLGSVFNMAPVLIDTSLFIFQASHTGLHSVTVARFGGIPHSFTADYPDLAALRTATVGIGQYATCLAQGLIRMGLTADGVNGAFEVTCDVSGLTTLAGGVLNQLMARAAEDLGVEIDTPSIDAAIAAFGTYGYGRVITESVTWSDVLNDLCGSLGLFWGVNRLGEIGVGWLAPPDETEGAAFEIDSADVLEIDRLALPDGFEWPHAERTVLYRRNWAPQNTLAAIVANPGLTQEHLQTRALAEAALTTSVVPDPLATGIRDRPSADDYVYRLIEMHGTLRRMYSLAIPAAVGTPGEVEQVRLTYPRFGLERGRLLRVLAVEENHDEGRTVLTLWG